MEDKLVEKIVELCVNKYNMLPKTGKPTNEEWTVVAAVVEDTGETRRVVSLGTGSKCVGLNGLSPFGNIVHDSHAEVVARRGFLLYLMSEIESAFNGDSHLFQINHDGGFELNDNIKFWFVCSAVPCGDAVIIPKEISSDEKTGKRQANDVSGYSVTKKPRLLGEPGCSNDIHRTGAKCVPHAVQDKKGSGSNFHVTGQVRTKPGRGDPTASVSCSDKLARWNAVGVQGALLSLLVKSPIFFSGLIVAGNSPFSEVTLERAINARIGYPGKMFFINSKISFGVEKNEIRKRPAPCSILYSLPGLTTQVAVEGRRIGTTKTKCHQSSLLISKVSIFQKICSILEKCSKLPQNIIGVDYKKMTYREMKDLSLDYQKRWTHFKADCFKAWTVKNVPLENFKISDC